MTNLLKFFTGLDNVVNIFLGRFFCVWLMELTFNFLLRRFLADKEKVKMKFYSSFEKRMLYVFFLKKMLGGSSRSHTLFKNKVQPNAGFIGSSGNYIESSKETTFFHAWNATLLLIDLLINIKKGMNKILTIIFQGKRLSL